MILFIISIVTAALAVVALVARTRFKYNPIPMPDDPYPSQRSRIEDKNEHLKQENDWAKRMALIVGIAAGAISLATLAFSTIYTQSVGQAKVIVNLGGEISHQDETAGLGFKAPWQRSVDFDLFAQQATYAGTEGNAPDYTGGAVQGQEVTASVKGGAQVNFDLTLSYNQAAGNVTDLYKAYRAQEKFVSQIVAPEILTTARTIPSDYTPVEFRGEKRGEATQRLTEALNDKLDDYGVKVTLAAIQNVRYTDEVESSIKNVEVSQQKEAQAEAELRATEVSAQAKVVEAEAEAKANKVLSESLTPEVLESKRLDTLREIGNKGNLVITDTDSGTDLLVQPNKGK